MMPKDPTKNIFQYKIRGGHLNEFEFHKNQGDVREQHDRPWEKENFDPNAAMPGQDPAAASPKAQAKRPRSGGSGGKQAAKASQKGSRKDTKKQAARTASKSGSKKTTSKSAKKSTAAGKRASTGRAKTAGKAASRGQAKKAFKQRKVRAGVR